MGNCLTSLYEKLANAEVGANKSMLITKICLSLLLINNISMFKLKLVLDFAAKLKVKYQYSKNI
ncbi:hypothetical protein GCM10025767_24440 [Thalassotalea piscium]